MSWHCCHCHNSHWKADGSNELSLVSWCRHRGKHRALTVLVNDEQPDVTAVFGHSNLSMLWGALAASPRLQGARRREET